MSKTQILTKEIGLKKLLTFRSWHNSVLPLVRGFYVSRCLESLEICGCIDTLREEGKIDLNEFIEKNKETKINRYALESVFDYLFSVGIFSKEKGHYILTSQGKRVCLPRHGFFDFIQAYGPIFYNLPEIIGGKMEYGKDFSRKDHFVAKATAEVSEWLPLPAIRFLIKKYRYTRILDIGCGHGELLISLAQKTNLTHLRGIDIADDSIFDGNEKIKKLGLSGRVFLKVGDILEQHPWADWLADSEVVTIMFVLHEFLVNGEEFVINFLRNLKNNTNNKGITFLIAETPYHEPNLIRQRPTSIAEHHLFHKLSNQGIVEKEQLRCIVKKAGLSILEDLDFSTFSQHYILAQ